MNKQHKAEIELLVSTIATGIKNLENMAISVSIDPDTGHVPGDANYRPTEKMEEEMELLESAVQLMYETNTILSGLIKS